MMLSSLWSLSHIRYHCIPHMVHYLTSVCKTSVFKTSHSSWATKLVVKLRTCLFGFESSVVAEFVRPDLMKGAAVESVASTFLLSRW